MNTSGMIKCMLPLRAMSFVLLHLRLSTLEYVKEVLIQYKPSVVDWKYHNIWYCFCLITWHTLCIYTHHAAGNGC